MPIDGVFFSQMIFFYINAKFLLMLMTFYCLQEIRGFWGNVEKVFEFRLKTQIEARRKRALDQVKIKIIL